MITERDAKNVKRLIQEHFGHHAYPAGVFPTDIEINEKLLEIKEPLPTGNTPETWLSLKNIERFLNSKGFDPSRAYLKKLHIATMLPFNKKGKEATYADAAENFKRQFYSS
jgi:hypothetical protein